MSLFNRTEPLTLVGPKALWNFMQLVIQEGGGALSFPIEFIQTDAEKPQLILEHDDFTISSVPLKHRVPCTGFVLREKGALRKIDVDACESNGVPVAFYESLKKGADYTSVTGRVIENEELTIAAAPLRSYAYISDTIFDPSIVPYIENVTLLYHESTFLHDRLERAEQTYHTTALQAGKMAALAKVKQLVLGHYSARYDSLEPILAEAKQEFEDAILGFEGLKLELSSVTNKVATAIG